MARVGDNLQEHQQ